MCTSLVRISHQKEETFSHTHSHTHANAYSHEGRLFIRSTPTLSLSASCVSHPVQPPCFPADPSCLRLTHTCCSPLSLVCHPVTVVSPCALCLSRCGSFFLIRLQVLCEPDCVLRRGSVLPVSGRPASSGTTGARDQRRTETKGGRVAGATAAELLACELRWWLCWLPRR